MARKFGYITGHFVEKMADYAEQQSIILYDLVYFKVMQWIFEFL